MGLFTLVFYVAQIVLLRRICIALECIGDDDLSRDVLASDGFGDGGGFKRVFGGRGRGVDATRDGDGFGADDGTEDGF